jgi:hypothetical protein
VTMTTRPESTTRECGTRYVAVRSADRAALRRTTLY